MNDDLQIQWKVGTKRPRVLVKNTDEDIVEEERQYVLSIAGSKIDVKDDGGAAHKKNAPLVIPLITGITAKAESESLDNKAEQEILQDLGLAPSSNNNTGNQKTIALESASANGNKKAPLLLQNIPEEVRNAKDDEEKFKYDIANRAEDISVKSEAYSSIPVEEFGAALLRGMGWKGEEVNPLDNKVKDLTVRPSRLGLGAAPKLQDNKKGPNTKNDQNAQQLNGNFIVGGLIQILDQSKFHERRAIISKASGVPGLNKIRVLIEKYGDEYDVSKSAVRNLHPKELKEKPFKYPKPVETKTEDSSSLHDRDMNKVSSSHPSSCHSSSTKAQSSSKVVKDEPEQSIIVGWIRPGIKVKLVSKKYGDHLYLHKGYIVDVLSKGFATVKLENGCMVDSIAEKHLETSLPTIGGNCMVIYGEHRGEIAILMQKHKEMAVIQLAESYEMVQLSLDWVAGVLIDN